MYNSSCVTNQGFLDFYSSVTRELAYPQPKAISLQILVITKVKKVSALFFGRNCVFCGVCTCDVGLPTPKFCSCVTNQGFYQNKGDSFFLGIKNIVTDSYTTQYAITYHTRQPPQTSKRCFFAKKTDDTQT